MRYGPTPALARAVLLGAAFGTLGVLAGNPTAVLVALPFVVYAAWALVTRPAADAVTVRAVPVSVAIKEGDAVDVMISAESEAGPDGEGADDTGSVIANWPSREQHSRGSVASQCRLPRPAFR